MIFLSFYVSLCAREVNKSGEFGLISEDARAPSPNLSRQPALPICTAPLRSNEARGSEVELATQRCEWRTRRNASARYCNSPYKNYINLYTPTIRVSVQIC